MYSQSEENYLKAIFHLQQQASGNVPTSRLSEQLDTRAASVTEMVKKLADKGLVKYKRYYGVTLTEQGRKQALMIIRKHRLWETFLVQKLDFTWDEVHEVAEQLEHIKSKKLIDAIDTLLDHPSEDPHGDPIPDARGQMETRSKSLLSECAVGAEGTFVGVRDDSAHFLKFLDSRGIKLGATFRIEGKESYDESLRLLVDDKPLMISKKMSANLYIAHRS